MKYPVISIEELERFVAERLDGTSVDANNSIKWIGSEPEVDLTELRKASDEILTDLAAYRSSDDAGMRDQFEGRVAGRLHAALTSLPLPVLDDPGFWRYVGAVHLWEFVLWREGPTFARDWTAYRKYVDGRNHSECVALRMFLRGQIAVREPGDYDISTAVPRGTDLWRSHVVRVRTSYSPILAQGLISQVAEHAISTDDVRSYAKRITRVASNVVLSIYDEDEVAELLDELRPSEMPPVAP